MRHQAQNVEPFRIDPGNIINRAIRIGLAVEIAALVAIAEGDAAFRLDPADRLVIGDIISFAMRNCDLDDLALQILRGEGRVRAFDPQMLHLADEAQIRVAHQDTWQEAAFDEDLKTIANAENEAAPRR